MRCIDVVEGEDFALSKGEADRMRDAVERLRAKLKPSFNLLSERAGTFRLTNVVGTIDLGGGTVVQVAPKVSVGDDWTTAIVSLLTGKEGIDVAGDRLSGFALAHNKLLDAVASVYLQRLERAFRQEGPIVLMEQKASALPNLKGKLDVSKWTRTALWRPHIFPVVRTEFAQDNPFTRGLLLVSETLAHMSSNQRTRSGLRALSRDLSAGLPKFAPLPTGLASRSLPEQWSAYKPAWSLAIAILSKTSLFGPTGSHSGVGLALEAWPLLETLLERTLQAAERMGKTQGRNLSYRIQGDVGLLRPLGPLPQAKFSPTPDGRLFEDGRLLASFEAKYSSYDGNSPQREHIYQALSTAAACGAPVAVLVYPEVFEPQVWAVSGFGGRPAHLVAIGLGLYRWYPPAESNFRGEMLLRLLNNISAAATSGAIPSFV